MIVERYDAFLFDLDGVLYRGASPVPHAAGSLARLREMGKGIAFVTNNSGRPPSRVVERLRAVGVEASTDEVETSALTTASILAGRGVGRVFVVGEDGLIDALTDAGVEIARGDPDEVDAVVVGWDRGADYDKLRTASVLVQRGASLIATNPDASFPAADGTAWPGAGALLAAIEVTTGARGEVMGKPFPPVLRAALDRAGGGRPLLVGDRLDTDIAGAAGLGWDSMLVLTGIAAREDLPGSAVHPTHVVDDLRSLFAEG